MKIKKIAMIAMITMIFFSGEVLAQEMQTEVPIESVEIVCAEEICEAVATETDNCTVEFKDFPEEASEYITEDTFIGAGIDVGKSFYSDDPSVKMVDSGVGTGNIKWDLYSDKTLVVSLLDKNGVSELGSLSAVNNFNCKKVIVGSGITKIGEGAFLNCNSVETIELPSGVTSIGDFAFSGCSALKSVILPESIASIGDGAFRYCSSLQRVDIPKATKSIGDQAFSDCGSLQEVIIPENVASIGDYAFAFCPSLAGVEIPDNVTDFGEGMFWECDLLVSITIPKDVKRIGYATFYGCDSLVDVKIPDGVTYIAGSAFRACPSLKRIFIPESVRTIGDDAFSSRYMAIDEIRNICKRLAITDEKEYAEPRSNSEAWGDQLLSKSALISIEIPKNVSKLGNRVFYGCYSLDMVDINSGLEEMGDQVFAGCSSLTDVVLPDSITKMGAGTFSGCTALKYAGLSKSINNLPDATFEDCISMESIEVPDGIKSIGDDAFKGCKSLIQIEYCIADEKHTRVAGFPKSIEKLGKRVFSGCTALKEIKIPKISTIEDLSFDGCVSLKSVEFSPENTSIGACAFRKCTSLETIEIPASITSIGSEAFSDCNMLERLIIPYCATFLGEGICAGCNQLKELQLSYMNGTLLKCFEGRIPTSLKKVTVLRGNIVAKAFQNLSIKEIILPGEYGDMNEIGEYAFDSCSLIEEIKIPESVNKIGDHAFSNCENLKNVILPRALKTLGNSVFEGSPDVRVSGYEETEVEKYCKENGVYFNNLGKASEYAIKYVLDGGENDIENPEKFLGERVALKPAIKKNHAFRGWFYDAEKTKPVKKGNDSNPWGSISGCKDLTLYAKWEEKAFCTITWKNDNEEVLLEEQVPWGAIPQYKKIPQKSPEGDKHFVFICWKEEITPAYDDAIYRAIYFVVRPRGRESYIEIPRDEVNMSGGSQSGGGSGGGSTVGASLLKSPVVSKESPTFSANWFEIASGIWGIRNKAGDIVTNSWLCDDAVAANGQSVWYLMNEDGSMLAAGLVQDNTGNYYSLEMNHNGYFGMLRYQNGTYDGIYIEFSKKHDGTFGAITNQSAIDALKAKYGVTKFSIGNEKCVYTKSFE